MMVKKKEKNGSLKKLYKEFFKYKKTLLQEEAQTLEQPTPYELRESVTTYGAYEDPI